MLLMELGTGENIIAKQLKNGWRAYWETDITNDGPYQGSPREGNYKERVFRSGDGAIVTAPTLDALKERISYLLKEYDYLPS